MLEIKNVTKIYKSKGGVETKALDDVSISFGETGLVFLLGKSGSGKSTLLNVSGGLDEPSSGEVIVKGKSSKEFSGSDFDSYRNTFVGFIFQEYNILDEFNVEDNIALALELQGKPKDRQKIAELLKDVDLEAYAKRKPNTLSGGQKQRIAIARALVKDPQIIMADEPTGALDSNTGKQVFDTLKKLSETRLVIVVSHDREFAEIYGDRIVELKDGKIISDVSKSYIAPEQVDENVSIIGENTLSIKSGASLTKKNIKTIQDFILNTQTDVIVTKGEAEIKSFKKAARMGENGETERFNETGADAVKLKEYTKEDSKFIRSRLPAAKAIKIGASGLKLKPVRLVFTILLSFIAFTMFGLFSTLMVYDGDKVASKSFAESGIEYLNLNKSYAYDYGYDDGYLYSNQADFTPDEYESLKKQFGDGALAYYSTQSRSVDNVRISGNDYMSYYRAEITSYAYVPENHAIRSKIISGKYPVNDDEICISSYFLDVLKNSKFYNAAADGQFQFTADKEITVNGVNDVLGKYLVINLSGGKMYAMKVCGVFDSGEISSDFDELKANSDNASFTLVARFNYELTENMHQFAFVSESYLENYPKKDGRFNRNFYGSLNLTDKEDSTTWIGGVSAYGEGALPVIFNRPAKDSLAADEIIISADNINKFDLSRDYYESHRDE
ncbi:MAG: ABC transporter ATP-binding protein, partial [Clostridia bacterium]|nr:ABC transporter ATP-binding protein [Clostridia bacterium]